MDENRIKNQSQQPVTVMMVPQPMDEDEINLLDLWRTLMRRKRIVLAVAGLAVVAGLAYALLAPPVYKAEAFLLPPADKDVQGLNMQGLNMQGLNMQGLNMQGLNMQITPEKAYQMAIRNLKSRSLRRRFFDVNGLVKQMGAGAESVEDVFEKGFNEALKVEQDKKRKAFVAIAFEGRDAGLAAQWVNDFLGLVQKETVNTLVSDMRERIENAKRNLREGIAAKRKLAENRRLDEISRLTEADRIARAKVTSKIISIREKEIKKITDEIEKLKEGDKVTRNKLIREITALRQKEDKKISDRIQQLKEAIRIASSLGISDPVVMSGRKGGKETGNGVPTISVNVARQPLYFRGAKALESEMKEMDLRRKHLDAFISGLRKLQERLALLKVNSRVEALKSRMEALRQGIKGSKYDHFIPGLRELQERLALLKVNRRVEALRQRKNDDPFISGLRGLQEQLAKLESIHLDSSRISAMSIDQAATPPEHRIKPKRKLIVLLALFGGLMLGVFAAFFAEFLAKARREQAEASASE